MAKHMEETQDTHQAGFVNIIGKPNVGKSTLLNALMGEKLAITTYKAQTTRHRIMGIYSEENYQIIFSDTPGAIAPKYELHKAMMSYVNEALEDADIILFMVEVEDKSVSDVLIEKLRKLSVPILLLINKVDLTTPPVLEEATAYWQAQLPKAELFPIAALHQLGVGEVFNRILALLPVHPPFFDKEQLTDRTERFIAAEVIREKIFLNYKEEIPYSSEVQITYFKEEGDTLHIRAEIMVERESQKGILIGKKGLALKKVGTEARKDLEQFFRKKVFLEQHVKVEKDWRKQKKKLARFGYNN